MNLSKLAHIPLPYPILIHGAFSLQLILSCWELEQCIKPYSLIHRSTIHLEVFLRKVFKKPGKVPQMILSNYSMYIFLTRARMPFSFPTKGLLWSLKVGPKIWHTCTSYIAKSKSESMKKPNHTNVIKMCMCMEWNGTSGDMTNSLPWIIPLLYFSWTCAIHFFWHALWACGIPYFGMHLFIFLLTHLLSMCHTFFGYASFHSFFFILWMDDG